MLDLILGKGIATYVKRHRGLVLCAILLTAVSSIFVLVPAYLLQPFVDEGMKSGSDPVVWKIPWFSLEEGSWFSWQRTEKVILEGISPNRLLLILTGVAFVSVLIKSITIYLSGLAAAALSNRAVKSLRVDLFSKFVFLPLSFHQKEKSGELVARATADLTVMQAIIASVMIGLIEYPLTALVFLCYLLVVNYKLTLLVFFAVPLILGLIRLFGRKAKKHAIRVQDAIAWVTSAYQETLVCLKVVQGFFTGNKEISKFEDLAEQLYKRVMKYNRWLLGMGPLMDSTVFLLLPGVLIVGKVYFDHSLGELMAMIYAFSKVYSPVKKLALVNNNLKTLQGATQRVFGIMEVVPDIRDNNGAVNFSRHSRSIEFRDVSFGYKPDEMVLKDISLEIEAGEMVAFVGSTGAGKSTLLDLIPRFFDVTSGSILLDGRDIRDAKLESLRTQIGIVNQEVLLFNDTIASNIAYGAEKRDMDSIVKAARVAYAHDFIMAQPDGYETVVGDRGSLLSGGQRQRIAIARALMINPSIILLDEAASALDTVSERLVQEAIESIKGGPTIIVVAHRLSTIAKANRIFVLEKGEIIEQGSRDELLGKKGRFRQLYDMQFS